MQDNYVQNVRHKDGLVLDPRTKIILLLIANIPAFTSDDWYVLALTALIPISLFAFKKRYQLAIISTFLYAAALWVDTFIADQLTGIASVIVVMVSGMICRMLPGLLMGYYLLSTTTVSEFVAAMERIHMPKVVIIPFSVMFRFFPTIKEEASAIADAMRMRDISLGKTRGGLISLMEYRMVPLLISCVKIGDELSSSALTRGLGSPIKRTNICRIGFRLIDGVYLLMALVTLVLFVKGGGGSLW